jgi:Spy/CpxP family protein refolding chaperone
MSRLCSLALLTALLVLAGGTVAQDTKEPKNVKKEAKKDEAPVRVKGVLPANWKKLGLTDAQVQGVYRVQNKYNEEIDKHEAKIKELKAQRDKEMKEVLTPDQKKRLDEILTGKGK